MATTAPPPVRDRLLLRLSELISAGRIANLRYDELAVPDPKTKYIDVRRQLVYNGRVVPIDDALAEVLEDYLNAQPPGRPFLDYRPELGDHLFPSAHTGGGISRWTVLNIRRRRATTNKPGPEGLQENDDDRRVD